jgi:cell pole-organizing protein PopZ
MAGGARQVAKADMAQASSAQREPSMEEILASIRRIIEENDAADRGPARGPSVQRGEPVQRAEPVQRSVIEVDAFRAEARAQPEPQLQPEIEPEPVQQREVPRHKPLLAEIQAQLVAEAAALQPRWKEEDVMSFAERLAAAERASYRRSPDDVAQAIENSRAAREDARALLGIPEPANTARAPESFAPERFAPDSFAPESFAHSEPAARHEPVFQQAAEPVSQHEAAPAHQPEPVFEPAPEPSLEPLAEPIAPHVAQAVRSAVAESGVGKPVLMSARVERQVASSFSELSEAFVERSRKTFDEIAEQMIAPLLRDWMENNLPTLVERMVREEIERVARGAQ